MIKIQCTNEKGFRRGGIHHPAGISFYPEDFFSAENLSLIKDEPKLMVQTGLEPKGPETASMDELKKALSELNVEFNPTDPRELLVSRLAGVIAEKEKGEGDKPKSKKDKAE